MLFLRSLQVIARSLSKPRLSKIDEETVECFRVSVFDLDVYFHMNHAKYLNYIEACRWGIQLRTGFLKAAFKQGWIGPIKKVSVEYYRPLKLFQKYSIHSRIICIEEKWFWVLHQFFSGDKEIARALVQGSVRKGRDNIPPSTYLPILNYEIEKITLEPEIAEWLTKNRVNSNPVN